MTTIRTSNRVVFLRCMASASFGSNSILRWGLPLPFRLFVPFLSRPMAAAMRTNRRLQVNNNNGGRKFESMRMVLQSWLDDKTNQISVLKTVCDLEIARMVAPSIWFLALCGPSIWFLALCGLFVDAWILFGEQCWTIAQQVIQTVTVASFFPGITAVSGRLFEHRRPHRQWQTACWMFGWQ